MTQREINTVLVNPPVARGERGRVPSIEDYLTDGSIARLCDEMGKLTGVPIWLRNAAGRVIVPGSAADSGKLWSLLDADEGARRAFALVGRAYDERADLFIAPLRMSVGQVGEIVLPADWTGADPTGRRALERAITLLASTAVESCEDQVSLRRRVNELDALFRLSSLLARDDDPDKVLHTALQLAIEVLSADAGTILATDGDTGVLVNKASYGLSDTWLARQAPLSNEGVLRARALAGEVVAVADLRDDDRIADHDAPQAEGLVSLITTGLLYQGRAAGLIRLYTRARHEFSVQDADLLRAIADHAAMALAHARLRRLREEDQLIKRQVRLAADVQRRMLPQTLPQLPEFDLAARYNPSFHLGGDFYDLFVRRHQLVLSVCDVVGKGVPAALLMSSVRASLRAYTQDLVELDEVMSRLNKSLARDTLESEFATLWLGVADPRTLRLTYCGAGHDPPLIFRVPQHRAPSPADVDELPAGGMALGIDPSQRYQLGSFDLLPHDVLVSYTDGVSEASDFENRRFGKDRIKASVLGVLASEPQASASRIADHLLRELRNFCGLKSANDDVTLVVLRVREPVATPDTFAI
ncbi:MAG: PP2C family protein-serine/threonine phosphatase [Phycisphaerales bacterium]